MHITPETKAGIAGFLIESGAIRLEDPNPKKTGMKLPITADFRSIRPGSDGHRLITRVLQDQLRESRDRMKDLLLVGMNDPHLYEPVVTRLGIPYMHYDRDHAKGQSPDGNTKAAMAALAGQDRRFKPVLVANALTNGNTEAIIFNELIKAGLNLKNHEGGVFDVLDFELIAAEKLMLQERLSSRSLIGITDVLTHPAFIAKFDIPTYAQRLRDVRAWYEADTIHGRSIALPF